MSRAAPTPGALPLAPGLYPARRWPANILRLHLVFPRPVDPWHAAEAVGLEDAAGRVRADVFVDLPGGLWSPCGRILTVLLHPGRVKRGLAAGARLGPALIPGETLALTLAPGLRAADGAPHGLPARFALRIGPAVTGPMPPGAVRRTSVGLRLAGPAPIDALGALEHVRLSAADGRALPARLTPHRDGSLSLAPRDSADPRWRVRLDPALEDCCGNRRSAGFARAAEPSLPPA
jgi:hypothetical protein